MQHLAQQQSQHKLQWSILGKRTFRHIWQASMANQHSGPHNVIIKRMEVRAALKKKESDPLGHWAAGEPKRSLQPRNEQKPTSSAMKRMRN
jgi:hypothetical protein